MQTRLKTPQELEQLRANAEIHKIVFDEIKKIAIPGTDAKIIDDMVWNICNSFNVLPAFYDLNNFKGALCINVNDCVAHGLPCSQIVFKEGDVVTFDFGVKDKKIGLNTDAAFTMIIGKTENPEVERFIEVNRQALLKGIKKAVPGNRIGDIGKAIEKYITENGFFVVKKLRGHAIGYDLHEMPFIPNFDTGEKGEMIVNNMTLCIEPLIGFSSGEIVSDESGIYIEDGSLGCQFEHLIAVREGYPEIII